jgi:membrane-bound metal-dependent hydrolase YbcI (DUF457 family)
MMYYDHALLGATLALSLGVHRRHGWGIILMATGAGALPDWDAISRYFGPAAYARVHRVWGHNLVIAFVASALFGALCYLIHTSVPTRRASPNVGWRSLLVWMLVGALASLGHVLTDVFYSGKHLDADWPVALFWPFTDRTAAVPLIPWNDWGVTIILLVELALLYPWRARAQLLATGTLLAVLVYVGCRAVVARMGG